MLAELEAIPTDAISDTRAGADDEGMDSDMVVRGEEIIVFGYGLNPKEQRQSVTQASKELLSIHTWAYRRHYGTVFLLREGVRITWAKGRTSAYIGCIEKEEGESGNAKKVVTYPRPQEMPASRSL